MRSALKKNERNDCLFKFYIYKTKSIFDSNLILFANINWLRGFKFKITYKWKENKSKILLEFQLNEIISRNENNVKNSALLSFYFRSVELIFTRI